MNDTPRILFIELEFKGSKDDFAQNAARLAPPIANVPGLLWKIWIDSPCSHTVGGVYLFENEAALNAFVDGPIAVGINGRPEFSQVKMKTYSVLEAPSLITRGPVQGGKIPVAENTQER
jgi:hypothetical protein